MKMQRRALILGCLALLLPGCKVATPRHTVEVWMRRSAGWSPPADSMQEVEPALGHTFVVYRYPHFPMAQRARDPLGMNNIFALDSSGGITLITRPDELTAFLRRIQPPGDSRNSIMQLWARLGTELVKDDYYQFKEPILAAPRTMAAGGSAVTVTVAVERKNNDRGYFQATGRFDSQNRLQSVGFANHLKPGERPR